MSARFANKQEINNWNKLILSNPDGGNVFSSFEFAMQKETGGYKARFLILNNLAITVLEKNAPLLGRFWYLPKGPGIKDVEALTKTLLEIQSIAQKNGVFAIRIESELDKKYQKKLESQGLHRSRPIIPNPSTIILDIHSSLDNILESMPQKGRYAIKRAKRDGVRIEPVDTSDKNCEIMYKLLTETAKGQFGIRSYEYYKNFWQRFKQAGLGQLFFAYYDNQIVAGAYVMAYGKKSTYKDGASIRKKTAYGASHLLQWEVIKWAKLQGCTSHDLCGAPPSEEINNKNHQHYGIGLFKTAFSKNIIDFIGCYDFTIRPIKYKLWTNFEEKIMQRLHYYKNHDAYY